MKLTPEQVASLLDVVKDALLSVLYDVGDWDTQNTLIYGVLDEPLRVTTSYDTISDEMRGQFKAEVIYRLDKAVRAA